MKKKLLIMLFLLFIIAQDVKASEFEFNIIEIEQEYSVNSLVDEWGYILQTEIPEDGRIRIWIKDCTKDIYRNYLYISGNGSREWDDIDSWESRNWVKSTESIHSGWITVEAGTYYSRFFTDGTANPEAFVYIEYERTDEYSGEKESNDTFDEATDLILNEEYEGNFSKTDDKDYCKFILEAPGLIEITSTDIRNKCLMRYSLYTEDKNLNVNEIFYNYKTLDTVDGVADRLRLPAGTYYINVAHEWNMPEYKLKIKYTAESANLYEQEYNNISRNANSILPRQKYIGNLNTIEDKDFYKFNVPRKSYITLQSWIPRQLGDDLLKIHLYNQNLNELTSFTTTENPYKESKKILVEKGNYYIHVQDNAENSYGSAEFLDNLHDYSIQADVKCYTHAFNKKIIKLATTKSDGLIHCTCKVCGYEKQQTIKKITKISLSLSKCTYNGKVRNPSIIVKDSAGKSISSNNYTITKPSGRKNVGKYTYTIKFKNEYSGTTRLTLTINPKGTSITSLSKAKKAITVKWKKQSDKMATSRISGYQIQYSTSKKFVNAKTKTISGYKTTSKKITGLKSKKTYYIRVRTYKSVKINGKSTKLYSGWSSAKSVKTK